MKKIILIAAMSAIFYACSSDKGSSDSGAYREYIGLKDALVKSNPAEVRKEAKEFHNALTQLGDSSQDAKLVIEKTRQIENTEELAEQRSLFSEITEPLVRMAKSGALGKGDFFVQRCSMAFQDKGANWISDEKEIKNPYFGDEMLSCGEVIEEIK